MDGGTKPKVQSTENQERAESGATRAAYLRTSHHPFCALCVFCGSLESGST